jgi:Flp pilus assembly protein TadG
MILRPPAPPRRGALTVEMAAILAVVMLFLFSVFEYGRYVMIEHVLVNAVREGCRYAMVHCQDPTVAADVQAVVKQRMAGLDSQLSGFTVTAYPANNASATLGSTYPDDPITVKASGTLKSLFPTMPYIPTSFTMSSASTMTCEGN